MPRFKERRAVEVVGAWLSEYLPEVRMLAPGTIDSYGKSLQLYHAYLKDTGGPEENPGLVSGGLMSARMDNFDAARLPDRQGRQGRRRARSGERRADSARLHIPLPP